MSKKLIGLTLALALFAVALPASAAGLTQSQISAIISLLQSFGAEQSVVNNVAAALGGDYGIPSPLTCASFSDVSYGNFDNSPGGRVSQLQTWLGIPSSAFGFGTYGRKTQAAWDAKCGLNNEPYTTMPIIKILTPNGGESYNLARDPSMTLKWDATNVPYGATFVVEFQRQDGDRRQVSKMIADGMQRSYTIPSVGEFGDSSLHLVPGTYRVVMWIGNVAENQSARDISDGTITITSPTTNASSASIDRDSLIQKRGSFALTGSAANVEDVTVIVSTYDYHSTDFDLLSGQVGKDGIYSFSSLVRKERWSIPFYWNNVTTSFDVFVFDTKTKQLLAKDKLKVVGENPEIPSGLIDKSSLESTSNNPTITGTAIGGVTAVMVSIGGAGGADSKRIPVTNGRWSVTVNNANFNPDDFGGTVRLPNGNYPVALRSVHSDGGASTLTTGTLVVKAAPTAPVIQSITPSWGPVGTEVIIRGTGFTGQNSVRFGVGGKVVSGGDGTYIRYTIPSSVSSCDLWTSSTICPPGAVLVRPSSYSVSVSNVNGTSESKTFSVTSGTATPAGL